MNQLQHASLAMLLTVLMLSSGCRSNPDVRKQRYFESGQRFNSEGHYKEASIQFLNALKVDGDYSEAHYGLAQAYEHMGQFLTASEELERAIDAQPGNVAARLDLGNLMLAGGSVSAAQEQANAVLTVQQDNAGAHALLSAVASQQGQKTTALAEIQRAIELEPQCAAFHENLALLQAGDPKLAALAESEFQKAVQLDPGSTNARLLLASYYVYNKLLAKAEKTAWDWVATDPRSLTARADLAQIILKEGDWARAEQVLRQASKDFASSEQGASILADYYASSQQFDKARAEFSAQLAKSPRNRTLQKGYIRVLIQIRDFKAAKTVLASLKSNSKDPEVTALNGIIQLNEGITNDAVNALRDAARSLPEDWFIQYWWGKAAQAKGEMNVAENCFREAATLNPFSLEPLEELARIAGQRGDTALLEDVAGRAIASHSGNPNGYVWRAIVEMDRDSFVKAEADLRIAVKVAPRSWQAYLQFGKLRLLQKRFPEGSTMLEQALRYNPNSVQALRLLTDYDVFQKHRDRAMSRVKTQIQKSPANSYFYDLLAQLQIQNNQIEQAAETAQHAFQMNPADGEAVSLFAQISVRRGMTAHAIDAWMQWSNNHPNDAGALAVLGALEESRGSSGRAETYYKMALQIQPQQPIAANNLAYRILENDGGVDSALALAEAARRGMPDSPTTADTLAWAYYHKGTYLFARDLLEDAINIDPDCASMHYHLGMVYTKLNDKHNAALHLKKALLLAHDPQTTRNAKAALRGIG